MIARFHAYAERAGWPYIVIVLALAGNAELIADAVIGSLL